MQNLHLSNYRVGTIIAQSTQKLMDSRSRGAHEKQLETGELLTAQIDTIALLGHTTYELSLRKREAIKPNLNLNKEYGAGRSGTDPFLF